MMSSSWLDTQMKQLPNLSEVIERIKARFKTQKTLSIFTLLSTVLLGRYIYCKLSNKYIHRLPPGPIGLPFFGISFGKLVPYLRNKYYRSEILHATYGSNIVYYVLGTTRYVTIMSPDIARYVLQHKHALNRPKPAQGAGGVSVDAFVNINGEAWRLRRRLAQSVLIRMSTSSTMNRIIHQFLDESVFPLLDELISSSDGVWSEPRKLMSCLTFDTIFYLNFGRTISMQDEFTQRLIDLADRGARVDSSVLNFLPILRNFSYFTKPFDELRRERYELYSKLIEIRKKEYYNAHKDSPESYIDFLLQEAEENKSMTTSAMQSDLALMFNAGQDTTASSLEFSFSYLCKYPETQEAIRSELHGLFGVSPDLAKVDVMSKYNDLHQLRAFMHEILRISSIVPVGVLRYASNDIEVPAEIVNIKCNQWSGVNGCEAKHGYVIPRGSTIVYLSDKMHHTKYNNSQWRAFGNELVLQNWLDDDGKFVKNKEQFFAFGFGRRDCVGQELAKKEILITLAFLLLKYRMSFAEKQHAENPQKVEIRKAATRGVVIMKPPIPIRMSHL